MIWLMFSANLPLNMTFFNEPTREAVTAALEQLQAEMECPVPSPVVRKLRGSLVEGEELHASGNEIFDQ